jgi:ribulose-5-phosphate 4-epimerase/fuculose-1-phosphate aldolase
VATSCRILGMLGLVSGTTGHVSARIPGTDEMWVRCRGGDEYGLMFTGLHNIRRVNFDGDGPGMDDKHAKPNETPIHGEIYRAHPEVQSVVHAHPVYALRCGITDIPYRPFFSAYDPSALDIVMKGVPVFERSITVTDKELASEMLKAMGDRDVLLMRGHGITVTGGTVEAATTQAIRFDAVHRDEVHDHLATRKQKPHGHRFDDAGHGLHVRARPLQHRGAHPPVRPRVDVPARQHLHRNPRMDAIARWIEHPADV